MYAFRVASASKAVAVKSADTDVHKQVITALKACFIPSVLSLCLCSRLCL
jgi:hypothetical protein